MANRFTEDGKWRDPWFRKLTPGAKVLFFYLIENCDLAGFIEIDKDSIEFHTGLSSEEIDKAFIEVERCYLQKEGWLWIKKFIRYQKNSALNPENNAHKKILSLLSDQLVRFTVQEYETELGAIKGLIRGLGIGKGRVEVKVEYSFEEIWEKYPKRVGKKAAERHFNSSVKTDQDWTDINNALKSYQQTDTVKKGFIQNGSTWFNNWRDYVPEKPPEDRISLSKIREARGERL